MSGCAPTVTEAEPIALAWFASVTLNLSVNVPLTGWVIVKEPVPVYGPVPPVADTVQLNGLPAVTPEDGQTTVTTSGCGLTDIGMLTLVVAPLASLTMASML